MPFIIADENGEICHARKKIYNTERGAKMGYKAALDNYLQCWYLYDDDLDYHFYVGKVIPVDNSFPGSILSQAYPPNPTPEKEERYNELAEQFKSMYSIQEVNMSLESK